MRNLLVPGPDVIYVTPEGIIHYVMSHRYRPPNEFVAAALAAPPAGSAEYYACLETVGLPSSSGISRQGNARLPIEFAYTQTAECATSQPNEVTPCGSSRRSE